MVTRFAINRAPVLTLWAAVVARNAGHDWETALTLGQALAALNAQSKGRRLGIYKQDSTDAESRKKVAPSPRTIRLLGREVPVVRSRMGIRAAPGGETITPEAVQTYLEKKFGAHLSEARKAMETLARSIPRDRLEVEAFALYEKFRPRIPQGRKGWGARGELDLALIRRLAK
jgi:hypothetical protein